MKKALTIAAVVLAVLGVVGLFVALVTQPSHRWWYVELQPWVEPVATAIAAVATVVAAVGAVAALVYTRQAAHYTAVAAEQATDALALERGRDEQRHEEERRRQAVEVAAWFDGTAGDWVYSPTSRVYDAPTHYCLRNGSGSVVKVVDVALIPPGGEPINVRSHAELPPTPDGPLVFDLTPVQEHVHSGRVQGGPMTPGIQFDFTDSSGRRWRRHGDGTLQDFGLNM